MIDLTGNVYAENDTELLWPIEPDADFDKNKIKQRC